MPQRKARPGRQKSTGRKKGKRAAVTEFADAAADLAETGLQPAPGTGVEYPVPRLAWSLRPS